ncbi:MAG: hypothetical protein GSR74_02985 [Desulfurococcales archaeon]|nr:hypothetical protein [Desulfurococcales archaeon]
MADLNEELGLYLVVVFLALLVGATVTLAGGPLGASVLVDISIIAYALLVTSNITARHAVIALALGAHIAALLKYYSHPIVLPFVIVERGAHGYTLDIDLVQAVIAYELVFERDQLRKLLKGLTRESNGSRGSGEAAVV